MSAITVDSGRVARARSAASSRVTTSGRSSGRSASRAVTRPARQSRPHEGFQSAPSVGTGRLPAPLLRPAPNSCSLQPIAAGHASARASAVAAPAAMVNRRSGVSDRALLAIMLSFGLLLVLALGVVIQGFWMIGAGAI